MQGRGLSSCSRVSLCLAQRPTLRESDSLAPSLAYNISFPDSTLLFRAKQAARTNPSLFATRHPAYGISALLFVSLSLRIEYFIPDSVLPFFAQSGFASAKPARFLQRVIPPAEYPSFSLLHLRVKHLSCETFILFVIFSSSRNARHPCRPAGWDARRFLVSGKCSFARQGSRFVSFSMRGLSGGRRIVPSRFPRACIPQQAALLSLHRIQADGLAANGAFLHLSSAFSQQTFPLRTLRFRSDMPWLRNPDAAGRL